MHEPLALAEKRCFTLQALSKTSNSELIHYAFFSTFYARTEQKVFICTNCWSTPLLYLPLISAGGTQPICFHCMHVYFDLYETLLSVWFSNPHKCLFLFTFDCIKCLRFCWKLFAYVSVSCKDSFGCIEIDSTLWQKWKNWRYVHAKPVTKGLCTQYTEIKKLLLHRLFKHGFNISNPRNLFPEPKWNVLNTTQNSAITEFPDYVKVD